MTHEIAVTFVVGAYRERAKLWRGVDESLLDEKFYTMGYQSIPFAVCNNPQIHKRARRAA